MDIRNDDLVQFEIFTIHPVVNRQKQTHHIFILKINQLALKPKRVETEDKQLIFIVMNEVRIQALQFIDALFQGIKYILHSASYRRNVIEISFQLCNSTFHTIQLHFLL